MANVSKHQCQASNLQSPSVVWFEIHLSSNVNTRLCDYFPPPQGIGTAWRSIRV